MRDLVGIWRLVRAKATDDAGKPLPPPYGPQAMGLLTLTASGRMMIVACDGRPEMPADETRAYDSYIGNYTFDGTTLVTRVDGATEVSRLGGDQVRRVRFNGDGTITVTPPPRSFGAQQQHREIDFESVTSILPPD